jgi:hypothetical protein
METARAAGTMAASPATNPSAANTIRFFHVRTMTSST